MKPERVDTLLFLGSSSTFISSFLFQSAIYLAEQGYKIVYISASQIEKLPPSFKGVINPGTEVLKLIRFMYLSTLDALLDYLYSLHKYAQIPQIIIIDKLENYATLQGSQKALDPFKYEMQSALLCSSLLNAMNVCASKTEGRVLLIASIEEKDNSNIKLNSICDLFFTDMIYQLKNEDDDILIENIIGQSKSNKIIFKMNSLNKIVFKQILERVN